MFTIHATKKLRDQLNERAFAVVPEATTLLGNWYANVWEWKPKVVLFVNERTLLPVLVPLASLSTVHDRFRVAFGDVLAAIDIPVAVIGRELEAMTEHAFAKTASRSVLGTMNDFMFMAEHATAQGHNRNPLDLAVWLARTPCSPLFKSTGSPDTETRLILTGQLPTRRSHTEPSPAP
jgi:hypothetical protein